MTAQKQPSDAPAPLSIQSFVDIEYLTKNTMMHTQDILLSHLSAIITGSSDAIITKSLDGVITGWNPGAVLIFGYAPEEILGKPMQILIPEDRRQEEVFILERLKEGEQVSHFETLRKHKDGRLINVSVTISPIRDEHGTIVGASKIARDISERVKFEAMARQLELIVQSSDDAILGKSLTGIVTSWNSGAERIFGYSAAEMVGTHIDRLIPVGRRNEERLILEKLRKGQTVDHYETVRVCKGGAEVHVSVTISPIRDTSGKIIGASKIARDITNRKAIEKKLKLTSQVFTHTREGIAVTDGSGKILDVNDAFIRITGFNREEVISQFPTMFRSSRQGPEVLHSILNALKLHDHCQSEVWSRRKDGEAYAGLLTISAIRDSSGCVQNYVGIFADITALKHQQDQLERIAHFDPLTGLPNRTLLADRLNQAMTLSKRHRKGLGVLYLDLDGFKAVNDTYGHHIGDELLVEVSKRMKRALREVDTLARMGGDEFVAVLEDVQSPQRCMDLAQRVLDACSQPVMIEGHSLKISASIGTTMYPHDEADAEQLLRHADQAMYDAKQRGKNRCHMFDALQYIELRNKTEQVEQISQALTKSELILHYQPKVNMRTGEVVGVEALIRWQHPKQGLLGPMAFLPAIEGTLLSDRVCDWVIEESLRQMKSWAEQSIALPVSVNVGARQLQQLEFPQRLARLLAIHSEIDPSALELEILETNSLDDIAVVSNVMQQCRRLGVRFAVDDFGTGYSSLTYLKRLPAEVLKIDQSFVRDMLNDHEDLAIVQGVIGLAAAFHREVLAEGVESIEHGVKLIQLGCEMAQGYSISRPIAGAEIAHWIKEWQPDDKWGVAVKLLTR